jgi:putative membrane protein
MHLLPWILVFHLIGLVFWLGSLLTVTHILAAHAGEPSVEVRQALGRLEMKLLKGLAHPGAALMVISGVVMIFTNPGYYLHATWLHLKLLLVVVLIVLDLRVTFRARAFQSGRTEMRRSECMALHGAIALVFFLILILVLVKPFGAAGSLRRGPAAIVMASLAPGRLSGQPAGSCSASKHRGGI